ncbi:MAG TPA: hypothetical protein VFZ79_12310 [Acidimicrobiales bacterium]
MDVPVRRPLSFVAAGVALVALDFRTDLPDLLPDPVGWALVAVGAWSLALRPAALLAAVAAVASLAETALPYRYVYINPDTGEVANDAIGEVGGFPVDQRWTDVSDGRALAIGAAYAAGGVALWLVLGALRRRASATGDGAAAGRLRLLRAVVPAVWSLPALAVVGMAVAGDDRYDPVWDGNLELVGLAGVLVLGWLGVRCALDRDQPWARHPVPVRPSLRGTWS